ncbi:MAG: biosynthetic arginine decarboxylase [Thermoanaerobaculia bacterium]|nr:biosynthetic arginine decarboxylase [Thermoanaerobaculia bacterium]
MSRDDLPSADWTIDDSDQLYGLSRWGAGYFSIAPGGEVVALAEGEHPGIRLTEIVAESRRAGLQTPLLIRFPEIIEHRLRSLRRAFEAAIEAAGYRGGYQGVYPIKVNQERPVVEAVQRYGSGLGFGLEAGSKAELLAVLAELREPRCLVICNGYKDADYVRAALLANRLGLHVVLVVEKLSEIRLIERVARELDLEADPTAVRLGLRTRLSSTGTGHWRTSGGDRAKFGLGGGELGAALDELGELGLSGCVELLHFHAGSQISSIQAFEGALREAAWTLVGLRRAGLPIERLDVGGGLGVDYTGQRSEGPSSMNYDLAEYARSVVRGIKAVCDQAGEEHPELMTEAGRATVAHHSLLVVDVLGVSAAHQETPDEIPENAEPVVRRLWETLRQVDASNALESLHAAQLGRAEAAALFATGHLPLDQRGLAGDLYWSICRRVWEVVERTSDDAVLPDELNELDELLADTYFCNFSVFQSLPDAWAIDQIFPVAPIEWLDREPDVPARLVDITCDSDGRIESYVEDELISKTLRLHRFRDGQTYRLGIFLVGAYQESLGDLHNLLGDPDSVMVRRSTDGGFELETTGEGHDTGAILELVGYSTRRLLESVRARARQAVADGRLDEATAERFVKTYRVGLSSSTYLSSEGLSSEGLAGEAAPLGDPAPVGAESGDA